MYQIQMTWVKRLRQMDQLHNTKRTGLQSLMYYIDKYINIFRPAIQIQFSEREKIKYKGGMFAMSDTSEMIRAKHTNRNKSQNTMQACSQCQTRLR